MREKPIGDLCMSFRVSEDVAFRLHSDVRHSELDCCTVPFRMTTGSNPGRLTES